MLLLNGMIAIQVHVHRSADGATVRRIAHRVAQEVRQVFGIEVITDVGFKYDLKQRTPIYFLPTRSAFSQPEIMS